MSFTFSGTNSGAGLALPEFSGFGDIFGTAANIGADYSLTQPRTSNAVPTDALQSMQPVSEGSDSWSDFWRGTLQTVVGYAIVKDARQSGVTVQSDGSRVVVPVSSVDERTAAAPRQALPLLPILIVGAIVWAVARKG